MIPPDYTEANLTNIQQKKHQIEVTLLRHKMSTTQTIKRILEVFVTIIVHAFHIPITR